MDGSVRISASLLFGLLICGLAAAADYGAQPAYQQPAYQPPPQPSYQQPPSSYQPSQNSYGGSSYTQQSQPDYTVTDCFATIPSCRVDEANFQPYYSNNVASASDCAQLCLDHNKLGIWYNTGGTTQTVYCQGSVFKPNYVCRLYHQNDLLKSTTNQPNGRKRRDAYGAQQQTSYSQPSSNYQPVNPPPSYGQPQYPSANTGGYGGGGNYATPNNDVCQFIRPNCPGYGQSGSTANQGGTTPSGGSTPSSGATPTTTPSGALPAATTTAAPNKCFTPDLPSTQTVVGNALKAFTKGVDSEFAAGTREQCQTLCQNYPGAKCQSFNFYKEKGQGDPAECILHDKDCIKNAELCALDADTEYQMRKDC